MSEAIERATMRKVYWRLVPLLFLAMLFNYLDRFNIGFAALRMNHDLGFSPGIFGFGASLFFLGYMLLGVPSNLILHKLGAQRWLGWILLVWGFAATCTAFVSNPMGYYGVRFLLGMIESGFLPGAALYITYWFPEAYRARAVGGYIVAGQVAAVIGAPISALVMSVLNGDLSLHSWQWMFIVEGAPATLLGISLLALLTDRPYSASWLSSAQRDWLQRRLSSERVIQETGRRLDLAAIITNLRVWSLGALFGCALVGIYGMLIWLPQIVNELGRLSLIEVGILSAVPPLLGVIGTFVISYTSDRTGDRKYHLAGLYLVGGLALGASAIAHNPIVAYVLLCLVGLCINSGNALFWSLNASLMTGVAAAASIAFVNAIAQLGGLVGPWMIGVVRERTGNFAMSLLAMACFLLLAALIAALIRVAPVHGKPPHGT